MAYYIDIGTLGAWNSRAGTASGTCWYGLAGLQNAFDDLVAGDVCYIKGTGDCSKFYTVTYDASSGTTLTDGEEVTWDTGEGAWADGSDKGVVHCGDTSGGSGTVEIELTTGTMPADNDVIKGTTSTQTITRASTANAAKGLDYDPVTAGTNAGGFIKYIGVNASWTQDGTRAVIDLMGTVQTHGLNLTATADLLWFENIDIRRTAGSSKYCWNAATGSGAVVLKNCRAYNGVSDGFRISSGYMYLLIQCLADSNGGHGIYGGNNSYAFCCASHTNTSSGISYITAIGCISHDNTGTAIGFLGTAPVMMFNCVADGTDGGSDCVTHVAGTSLYYSGLIGCRITNAPSTKYGVELNSEIGVYGWNYFEDNSAGNFNNDTIKQLITLADGTTDTNAYDQADDDAGYVDSANHDFSTNYVDGTDPTLRRTAITIPWT